MADFSAFCRLVASSEAPPWLARFDLPGFGASPLPAGPAGSTEYAEIVCQAIRQVVADMNSSSRVKVVVVGHSFGGRIALSMGASYAPDLNLAGVVVSGVPLIRSPDLSKKPKLGFRVAKSLFKLGLVSSARMEKLRSRYGSTDYRNSQGIMREIFVRVVNEDYSEIIRRIEVPVNLLWGDGDKTVPVVVAERALQLNAEKLSLTMVPGDHFVAVTSPAVLLDSVLDLVQRTRG